MRQLATALLELAKNRKATIATAESCTGGMVSAAITSVPGSSEVFDRSFISYSNEAKNMMLGVDEELFTKFGAVSEEVVQAMVKGCIDNSNADIAVAITGVAGPGGGSDAKPVGLVYIAAIYKGELKTIKKLFDGDREQVRTKSSEIALKMMIELLS